MEVLNKAHLKRMPHDAVYIGRGSKWGNPFIIGKDGDRDEVVEKYRHYLWTNKQLLAQIRELLNKDLVCHCAPQRCHGDVLLDALEWDMRR
jgi:hypothetical protein